MMQLNQSDFRPGERFELWWRWADPKRVMLPESVLAQIHPLTAGKAQEIWQRELVSMAELWGYAFATTGESITSSPL